MYEAARQRGDPRVAEEGVPWERDLRGKDFGIRVVGERVPVGGVI